MMQINPTQFAAVLAFGSAALLAWSASYAAPLQRRRWVLIAAAHGLLAFEAVAMSRHAIGTAIVGMLKSAELYPDRRPAQLVALLILTGLAMLTSWRFMRGAECRSTAVATASTLTLLFLFGVESVSLHAVDQVLYQRQGPLLLVGWLWLACGLTTAIGAGGSLSRRR